MDKDIMKISIDNLAQKQLEFLKQHTIEILNNVAKLIEEENFEDIDWMLANSPAGDCMGEDNYFINFSYDEYDRDISEIVHCMKSLKSKIETKEKR